MSLSKRVINKFVEKLPLFGFSFLIIADPRLSPGVGKVDDQDELDDDKRKAPRHAKVHPRVSKGSFWDEKGTDHPTDHQEVLETPEPAKGYKSNNDKLIILVHKQKLLYPCPGLPSGSSVSREFVHLGVIIYSFTY